MLRLVRIRGKEEGISQVKRVTSLYAHTYWQSPIIAGIVIVGAFYPGQSHLIFGTGSTGCFTTSQLSKLCYAVARYKPLENLDVIALAFYHFHKLDS
jgi:hypothetical protein